MSAVAIQSADVVTYGRGVVVDVVDDAFGKQVVFLFENGFGASVICNAGSYGGRQGLWEIAVLNEDGEITCGTPITGDVVGWLDVSGVDNVLSQIAALPDYRIAGYSTSRPSLDLE